MTLRMTILPWLTATLLTATGKINIIRILPLEAMQSRYCERKSVSLSVTRVFCNETKKPTTYIILYKRANCSFMIMVCDVPFHLKCTPKK